MINKKILMIGTMSALLATTVFGAGTSDCPTGVCFATINNPTASRSIDLKKEKIVILEQSKDIDKSMTIVLDGETITVFPKSSYVINNEEAMDFRLLIEPIVAIEDKILEKTNLPSSEYFCEKDKHPVYLNQDVYECV